MGDLGNTTRPGRSTRRPCRPKKVLGVEKRLTGAFDAQPRLRAVQWAGLEAPETCIGTLASWNGFSAVRHIDTQRTLYSLAPRAPPWGQARCAIRSPEVLAGDARDCHGPPRRWASPGRVAAPGSARLPPLPVVRSVGPGSDEPARPTIAERVNEVADDTADFQNRHRLRDLLAAQRRARCMRRAMRARSRVAS